MATSIRELSFQMVLDNILKPAGVKVGGFPDEMFLDLSEDEQEKWSCNICFLLVKDCHECTNKHLFCHSCIVAWTMTTGQNSQRCPLCRCEQTVYASNKAVDRLIEDKRVTCPHENCTFTSPLKVFLLHSHGRSEYSNANIDLESLRSQHFALPGFTTQEEFLLPSFAHMQVLQGRVVAQQIRLLLHLEFWLRHQAHTRITRAPDQESQAEGLDEVFQLSEQLHEVGSVLSSVFAADLDGMLSAPRRLPSVSSGRAASISSIPSSAIGRANTIRHQSLLANLTDDDDSDSSSSLSNGSGIVSTARRDFVRQLESSATATASYASRSSWGTPHRTPAAAAAASVSSSSSPRVSAPSTTFSSPVSRTLSHRLLERPHDASRSLVTRDNTVTVPHSPSVSQSSREHVRENVTLPRVSPSQRFTTSGGSSNSIMAMTAVRDQTGATAPAAAATAAVSPMTTSSPPASPVSSGSSLSLFDTSSAASSVSSREASVFGAAVVQSSELVSDRTANTTSHPPVAQTTPRTSQVTGVATTRQTVHPPAVAATRRLLKPATDAAARRLPKPAAGAAKRRTSQPSNSGTSRRNSHQAVTRQPVAPRGAVQPSRLVRQPTVGATTRLASQPTSTRQPMPPRGTVPVSRTDISTRQPALRHNGRSGGSNSTTASQSGAPVTNARLPTTPGQLLRARRRSEISQEIADTLRKSHDHS